MHRSNIAVAVCAVRVEQQLPAWDDRPARPCFTCRATEQANHWRHIFLDCATAKMTWAAVYQGVMATTGMRVAMTEPLIQWNKLIDVEKKRMTRKQVKDTLSIISAGRSTLYLLYYAKIEKLNEMTLFDTIARSFRTIKNIARISGPKSRLHRLTSYPRPLGPSLASLISLDNNHDEDNHDNDVDQGDNEQNGAENADLPAPITSRGSAFFSENRLAAAITQVQGLQAPTGQSILDMVQPAIRPPGTTEIRGHHTDTPHPSPPSLQPSSSNLELI